MFGIFIHILVKVYVIKIKHLLFSSVQLQSVTNHNLLPIAPHDNTQTVSCPASHSTHVPCLGGTVMVLSQWSRLPGAWSIVFQETQVTHPM